MAESREGELKSARVHSNGQPGLRPGPSGGRWGRNWRVRVREDKETFPERRTPLLPRLHGEGGVLTPAALSKGRRLGSVAFTSSTEAPRAGALTIGPERRETRALGLRQPPGTGCGTKSHAPGPAAAPGCFSQSSPGRRLRTQFAL